MINIVWLILLCAGAAVFAAKGQVALITTSLFQSAELAVAFGIKLAGLIAFWSGIMKVAEEAGLSKLIARVMRPILTRLFPDLKDHPEALGAVSLALSANFLGLANAGTALSLQAMEEMQKINPRKNRATDAMCTFMIIIMGGLTLIPTTVVALRAQAGSAQPDGIIIPTLLASLASTIFALIIDFLVRNRRGQNLKKRVEQRIGVGRMIER
jgi:spore maturation protein A